MQAMVLQKRPLTAQAIQRIVCNHARNGYDNDQKRHAIISDLNTDRTEQVSHPPHARIGYRRPPLFPRNDHCGDLTASPTRAFPLQCVLYGMHKNVSVSLNQKDKIHWHKAEAGASRFGTQNKMGPVFTEFCLLA